MRYFPAIEAEGVISTPPALIRAIRCWCRARGRNADPMPFISRALRHEHAGIVAVVIDGLMTALSSGLGRNPVGGRSLELSEDEKLAVGLLDGVPFETSMAPRWEREHLGSAVLSARIMVSLIPDLT